MRKLVLLYLAMIVLVVACKKKEVQSETEKYLPLIKKIEGVWIVESSYDKSNGVITTYPNNLDVSKFTFTDSSRMFFTTPCNGGNAIFLLSENGGIATRNVANTNSGCPTQEGNDWDGAVKASANYAYHLNINGDKLTIISHGQNVKNLNLRRE